MDGLVELLRAERQLPLLGIDAIGRAQRGDVLVNQIADGIFILSREVPGSRNKKLRDGIGSFGQGRWGICILDKGLGCMVQIALQRDELRRSVGRLQQYVPRSSQKSHGRGQGSGSGVQPPWSESGLGGS